MTDVMTTPNYGTVAHYAQQMRAAVEPRSDEDFDVVCLHSYLHGILGVLVDPATLGSDAERRLEYIRNALAAAQLVREEMRPT